MRVISLFSGAGGLDLGFVRAGYRVVWANDNDPDSCATYRRNLGDHIVEADIAAISAADIPDGEIVIGGFPCQGFSVANRKRTAGDRRNGLYLEMRRVIGEKSPQYFLAENVKGLLSLDGGRVANKILRDFQRLGYAVTMEVLNAADYGVPQKRERVFIMGVKEGVPKIDFPPPTHSERPRGKLPGWISVGSALANIPEPEDAPHIPNHTCSKYKLRFNGHLGHRVINPDKPAPTITARGDNVGGVVVLHHPSNERRMSARELAAVQSFPMDFVFSGTRTSAYRQIANAVPPLLGRKIAEIFRVQK